MLDLFGRGFVLLGLGTNPPSTARIEQAARQHRVPLERIEIDEPEVLAAYERRLVLVRERIVFDGDPSHLPGMWHDPSHVHA